MSLLSAAIVAASFAIAAQAAELMPVARQNALVQKYCAVCHTDASNNGGLSLEHFDAAQAAPSLSAMLLSKLTGGVSIEVVKNAGTSSGAQALIDQKMKGGAMGAAGIPIPDKATIDALVHTLAIESEGAGKWAVQGDQALTASILRELPLANKEREARFYRLIVSCNAHAGTGFMQLAWSPSPQSGTLAASVDDQVSARFPVEGSEKMGNQSPVVTHGLAAIVLSEGRGGRQSGLPFPARTLTLSELFPGETVAFSFTDLPKDTRREMQACFPDATLPGAPPTAAEK